MRLTARGRVVAILLAAALAFTGMRLLIPVSAHSDQGAIQVISYTIRPGDTLWSYAQSITEPGGDVSETVDRLMRLNHLDTASLRVGQRLVVPVGDTPA